MPDKSKGKIKGAAAAAAANELNENLAAFTLPESLPCSEVSFPVLIQRKNKANWKAILQESEHKMQEIEAYEESKVAPIPRSPFQRTECDYIKNEIFVYLLPAMEEALNKAKLWNALQNQKCFFNGLDWIVQDTALCHELVEYIDIMRLEGLVKELKHNNEQYFYLTYACVDKLLWNRNPLHPERKFENLHLFNMPWVRAYLKEHPRPYYPKSWLWTEDYAATIIQKTVRQYFVQREEEVQEMRDFWRKLEIERNHPDIDTNPYLSKKFASERNIARLSQSHDKK